MVPSPTPTGPAASAARLSGVVAAVSAEVARWMMLLASPPPDAPPRTRVRRAEAEVEEEGGRRVVVGARRACLQGVADEGRDERVKPAVGRWWWWPVLLLVLLLHARGLVLALFSRKAGM